MKPSSRWSAVALLLTACADAPGQRGAATTSPAASSRPGEDMVALPGGVFLMGTDDGFPYEGPAHEVELSPFRLDRYEVTVADFRRFVEATGTTTEAERFGWSGAFDRETGAWVRVDGATWRAPEGPGALPAEEEPVTQVSWRDADAFCRHYGRRLPTEAELEYALRAGLRGQLYPWGDEVSPGGRHLANLWQGPFPDADRGEDGFAGRAPVGRFPPNPWGFYDLAGNVWEWCADWWAEDTYDQAPRRDPQGPASGEERVIRGGSWLCTPHSCAGFRAAARSHATPDSGLNNLGFRCAG
ncbi:MAG TPA: formylglycine-generating enzyme family protein [Thermoanaerobaculia bacterium]|nr:formylglycine-generating enzyme family protein [Thermoanaerobaculia bacterium]